MSDDVLRAALAARPKNGERIWVEEDDFVSGWGAAMDSVRAALASSRPEPLDVDEQIRRAVYSVWPGLGQQDMARLVTALRPLASSRPEPSDALRDAAYFLLDEMRAVRGHDGAKDRLRAALAQSRPEPLDVETQGDALHGAIHPRHPWSGCGQADLVYEWVKRYNAGIAREYDDLGDEAP